jgi:hypothetical protein
MARRTILFTALVAVCLFGAGGWTTGSPSA